MDSYDESPSHDEGTCEAEGFEDAVLCWRCDKSYPGTVANCPYCHAENRIKGGPLARSDATPRAAKWLPGIRVIFVYCWIAVFTVLATVVGNLIWVDLSPVGSAAWIRKMLILIGIVDVLFAAFVVFALYRIRVRPDWPRPPVSMTMLSWVASVPMLAMVLTINIAWHTWLASLMPEHDRLETLLASTEYFPFYLVSVCLMPAVFEELFFRRLALGAFLELMPAWQAVVITSIFFAFAHIGAPLSLPTLFLAGVALGTLRLSSGSLLLPMVFHFFHNLLVAFI